MKRLSLALAAFAALLLLASCGEEAKIKSVQATQLKDCKGKTVQDMTSSLLQKPVWGFEKAKDGKGFVTVNGTLVGDKLPDWVTQQKIMDVSFRFALDPKTEKFNPNDLEGIPSISTQEGILQAYKVLFCR